MDVPIAEMVLEEDQIADGMKWNEERIERRLRGEYERAGRQLHELVSSSLPRLLFFVRDTRSEGANWTWLQVSENLETPLRLNAIRIVGARTTRSSFLSNLVAPYLPTLPPASYLSTEPPPAGPSQTLRSVLGTAREVSGLFSKFDIFKEVDASLEASPSILAEAEDVDIVIRVKEAPRFFLRTATDIGDGEGSAVSFSAAFVRGRGADAVLRSADWNSTDKECFWRCRDGRGERRFRNSHEIRLSGSLPFSLCALHFGLTPRRAAQAGYACQRLARHQGGLLGLCSSAGPQLLR